MAERATRREHPDIPRLEWAIAAVGLGLVVACLSFLIYRAFAHEETPPDVTVAVEEIRAVGDGHLVRFEAFNHGGTAAAAVVVRGELVTGGATEVSEATLDFLPSESARRGGLYFRADPAGRRLTLRAVSYQDP